jgi:hypothetical protein
VSLVKKTVDEADVFGRNIDASLGLNWTKTTDFAQALGKTIRVSHRLCGVLLLLPSARVVNFIQTADAFGGSTIQR